MIEGIGWAAGILFALCGLPQAIKSYRDGHAESISWLFILMWLFGEVLMQIYVIGKHGFDMPLLVNYWVNTFFVSIILYFKIKPRRQNA